MTLDEILSNEEQRQHEFPVTRHKIYLAHAGVCPLPRRVAEAMNRYISDATLADQESAVPLRTLTEVRRLAAQLIQAQPEEIALVGPTSLALSFIAGGLPLGRNDNILIYQDDYPSNVYPWMALAEKRVEVRLMNIRDLGRIRVKDVQGQVDENTRLVTLASCHFISGWRIELEAIGQFLRQRNIAFCVDGIQTVGAFPTSVTHVDFLAADAHKWQLGPCAAGLLYVRKAWQDHLRPVVHGWHNVRNPGFVAQETMTFRSDARRYEAGTANLVALVGLKAALEMLLEIGADKIAAELLRKRGWLVPALQAKDYHVLSADAPPANAGPMLSFFKPGADLGALHARLTENNIITSLRVDRKGQQYLRLSPHFYNTDDELHRVLEKL